MNENENLHWDGTRWLQWNGQAWIPLEPVQTKSTNTVWFILAGAAGAVLLVLFLIAVAIGAGSKPPQASSVPNSTATEAPAAPIPDTDSAKDLVSLELAWSEQSAYEQQSICDLFNSDPDKAWASFNKGANYSIPRSTFNRFFNSKC